MDADNALASAIKAIAPDGIWTIGEVTGSVHSDVPARLSKKDVTDTVSRYPTGLGGFRDFLDGFFGPFYGVSIRSCLLPTMSEFAWFLAEKTNDSLPRF